MSQHQPPPVTNAPVANENKDKKSISPYWLLLLIPIGYFIYTNFIELKIVNIKIESIARDSIFTSGESVGFKVYIQTNGKSGKIKLKLFLGNTKWVSRKI